MSKLIATSPVGKNGQTVVPSIIRKMFKIGTTYTVVGFYKKGNSIEIAPVKVEKAVDYSKSELHRLDVLASEKGGTVFKSEKAAKHYLKTL